MLWGKVKGFVSRAGLDARAANIVMRVVRNVADTGRTIVCTLPQPAIDIFEVLYTARLSCKCLPALVAATSEGMARSRSHTASSLQWLWKFDNVQ